MKKNEKKMTLVLIFFVIFIIAGLSLFYFFSRDVYENTVIKNYKDVNVDLGRIEASMELFKRKDFLELEQNNLIQESTASEDDEESPNNKFKATRRNPFQPF